MWKKKADDRVQFFTSEFLGHFRLGNITKNEKKKGKKGLGERNLDSLDERNKNNGKTPGNE